MHRVHLGFTYEFNLESSILGGEQNDSVTERVKGKLLTATSAKRNVMIPLSSVRAER